MKAEAVGANEELDDDEVYTDEMIEEEAGDKKTKCRYCDNEATLLCDGTLPRWMMNSDRAEHLKGRSRFDVPTSTCDAPLCEQCAHHLYTTFWCGSEGLEITTKDLCPECCKYHHLVRQNHISKWRLKPTK